MTPKPAQKPPKEITVAHLVGWGITILSCVVGSYTHVLVELAKLQEKQRYNDRQMEIVMEACEEFGDDITTIKVELQNKANR
jgi:hypothetical protein